MRISMGIECGQRIWRRRSWRTPFRTFPKGFALGPIMFWRS